MLLTKACLITIWNNSIALNQTLVLPGKIANHIRFALIKLFSIQSSLLMKVKKESKKVGLKFNIQKTKIMASSPITSWEIDGETVADFIFGWGRGGSEITADGDRNQEIKRCLLLGRKLWPT